VSGGGGRECWLLVIGIGRDVLGGAREGNRRGWEDFRFLCGKRRGKRGRTESGRFSVGFGWGDEGFGRGKAILQRLVGRCWVGFSSGGGGWVPGGGGCFFLGFERVFWL